MGIPEADIFALIQQKQCFRGLYEAASLAGRIEDIDGLTLTAQNIAELFAVYFHYTRPLLLHLIAKGSLRRIWGNAYAFPPPVGRDSKNSETHSGL